MQFPLVDKYMSVRLGYDLERICPGSLKIIESERRQNREDSYGYIHSLWWVKLDDGREIVSARSGTGDLVASVLGKGENTDIGDECLINELTNRFDHYLQECRSGHVHRAFRDLVFACNARTFYRRSFPIEPIRLIDASIPPVEGLQLPVQCFPEGMVYGIIQDHHVVSVAYAHKSGVMEDTVADIGVVTAPAYRRRGYAAAVVSAVAGHIITRRGEARYACSPDNTASIRTAQSAGFVSYGKSLMLLSKI